VIFCIFIRGTLQSFFRLSNSFFSTVEEAIENIKEAIQACLESLEETNYKILFEVS
jgi:hypothetical protein